MVSVDDQWEVLHELLKNSLLDPQNFAKLKTVKSPYLNEKSSSFFLGLTNMSVYPLQALDESDITKYKNF